MTSLLIALTGLAPAQAAPAKDSEASTKALYPVSAEASESYKESALDDARLDELIKNAVPAEVPVNDKKTSEARITPFAEPSGPSGPISGPDAADPVTSDFSARAISFSNKHGRLYAVNYDRNLSSWCSASAINNPNRNMLLTAGHCVYSHDFGTFLVQNGWSLYFIPGYHQGNEPLGRYQVKFVATTPEWRQSHEAYDDDLALAIVYKRNGTALGETVGGLGIKWNIPVAVPGIPYNAPFSRFRSVQGYPSEYPYDGSMQYVCSDEQRHASIGVNSVEIDCSMTRGVSGSPWLIGSSVSDGDANGVVSNIDRIEGPTVMRSPYFDGNNIGSLYNSYANYP